jgi:hypothetical protein
MGRAAFAVSTMVVALPIGCGGRASEPSPGTSGSSGASTNADVSDGGAADVGPDGFASGTCSAGSLSCQGLQPQTCVDGQRKNSGDPCPYVCSDGACSGVCVPLTGNCDDVGGVGVFKSCGLDGEWNPDEACDAYFPPSCEAGTGSSCAREDASDFSGSVNDAGNSDVVEAPCQGGCLCFSTPETCPSDCAQLHRSDGSFVCGYACDGPGVPCNCVYQPDDGGIYVCDSFSLPACPAITSGACTFPQGTCMTCGTFAGPSECGCTDAGLFAGDAGVVWECVGTEEACKGP